jgi:acyl-CoA thioesterase
LHDGDTLSALLGRMEHDGGAYHSNVPESWMQGRTAYGGYSTALALAAARRKHDDLPPLRSAQIAFVGPLAEELEIKVELLRRGRTAAYVQSDVYAGGRLGLRALLVFMHAQESHVDLAAAPLAEALPVFGAPAPPPASVRFASNFELRYPGEVRPDGAHILRWVRLCERGGVPADVELLAVADMLPPAAMMLFQRHGPISSMTWQINMLTGRPETEYGWWLLEAKADQAQNGSSSQGMTIWNSRGEKVVAGMQSVALFV